MMAEKHEAKIQDLAQAAEELTPEQAEQALGGIVALERQPGQQEPFLNFTPTAPTGVVR